MNKKVDNSGKSTTFHSSVFSGPEEIHLTSNSLVSFPRDKTREEAIWLPEIDERISIRSSETGNVVFPEDFHDQFCGLEYSGVETGLCSANQKKEYCLNPNHDWIVDVLSDLVIYTRLNNLPQLNVLLKRALNVAESSC